MTCPARPRARRRVPDDRPDERPTQETTHVRRLLTALIAAGALTALAVAAYRVLSERQLDHPVADGRAG